MSMFDPPEGYFLISRDCLDNIVRAAQVAARAEVDYGACGTEGDRRVMVRKQKALALLLANFDEGADPNEADPNEPSDGAETFRAWLGVD